MQTTVAIQGEKASFHHIAARSFFGNDIEIMACKLPFARVFEALQSTDYAVCAIETSLYGQINEVYDQLRSSDAKIIGEVYVRTTQNLLGISKTSLEDITEIYSHPVAIAECLPFIKKHLPDASLHEVSDTAESARLIAEQNNPSRAAIAGHEAAKLHNLKLLAEDIDHSNYTRFVMLEKNPKTTAKSNKASIILEIKRDQSVGSLHEALKIFSDNELNLTLIHSRPLIDRAWHYLFYIDVEGEFLSGKLDKSIAALQEHGNQVVELGRYKSGNRL